MENQIVKIDHNEFGLEESKATEIANQFKPMLDKMVELENEYNDVVKMDINDPMTSLKAKEVRLKYVKVRTGTAEIHKSQKAFYLAGGRFVDGWKNAQLFASQGIEEKLKAIEDYHERLERERLEKLQSERVDLLLPYYEEAASTDLSSMPSDVFEAYLSTKKEQHEAKLAAEKKAEEERIAAEKAERERVEAQRVENERLKAEAEAREKEIQAELERLQKEQEEADRKIQEEREQERKEAEAREKAAQEKVEQERKERERVEAELKAERERKEAEEKAKREAEEKARLETAKAAKAPIKKRMSLWVDSFSLPEIDVENDTKKSIIEKFEAFKKWSNEQINLL